MDIPESLSIDRAYPGYRDDALAVGANLIITLDGVEQRNVLAYHIPGRSLVRYASDSSGRPVIEKDAFKIEIIEGLVEVHREAATSCSQSTS